MNIYFNDTKNNWLQTCPNIKIWGKSNDSANSDLTKLLTIKKEKYNPLEPLRFRFLLNIQSFEANESLEFFVTTKFKETEYLSYIVVNTKSKLLDLFYKVENDEISVYIRQKISNSLASVYFLSGDVSFVHYANSALTHNVKYDNTFKSAKCYKSNRNSYNLNSNLVDCEANSYLNCVCNNEVVSFEGIARLNSPSTEIVDLATIPSDIDLPTWGTQNVQINMAKGSNGNFGFIPVFIDCHNRKIKAYCNIRSNINDVKDVWINLNYVI